MTNVIGTLVLWLVEETVLTTRCVNFTYRVQTKKKTSIIVKFGDQYATEKYVNADNPGINVEFFFCPQSMRIAQYKDKQARLFQG